VLRDAGSLANSALRSAQYKANAAINGKGLVHEALAAAALGNTTALKSGAEALKEAAVQQALQRLNETLAPLAALQGLAKQDPLGVAIAAPIAAYDAAFKAANSSAAALKAALAAAQAKGGSSAGKASGAGASAGTVSAASLPTDPAAKLDALKALHQALSGAANSTLGPIAAAAAAAAEHAKREANATLDSALAAHSVLSSQDLLGVAIAAPIAAYDAAFKAANGSAAALKGAANNAAKDAAGKVYNVLTDTDKIAGTAFDAFDAKTTQLSDLYKNATNKVKGAVNSTRDAALTALGEALHVKDVVSAQDPLGVAIAAPIAAYGAATQGLNATRAALKAALANATLPSKVAQGLAIAQFGAEALHGNVYDAVDKHLLKRPLINGTGFQPTLGNSTIFKPGEAPGPAGEQWMEGRRHAACVGGQAAPPARPHAGQHFALRGDPTPRC
jgi:hypothetical protein